MKVPLFDPGGLCKALGETGAGHLAHDAAGLAMHVRRPGAPT